MCIITGCIVLCRKPKEAVLDLKMKLISVTDFQVGFDHTSYEIGEDRGHVNNEVYIKRLNENELQMSYNFTILVILGTDNYPADLGKFTCLIFYNVTCMYVSNLQVRILDLITILW